VILNLDFGLFSTILAYIKFVHQSFSIIITRLSPFALDLEFVRYIVLLGIMVTEICHSALRICRGNRNLIFKHNVTHSFSF